MGARAGGAHHVAARRRGAGVSAALATRDDAAVLALHEAVRSAAHAGVPLRIAGLGGWLDAGRPVVAARTLSVRDCAGIVEYVPGDLTMTARAGTPLAALHAAARAEGQLVPLDPWGGDEGSLGATLATATAGPSSHAHGLPRDVVLGLAAVSGTGELLRAGGRVVKNVAGFDLARLMIGAWGTLGVLAEATVRLRAIPEADETLALALDDRAPGAALAAIAALPVAPIALELVSDALASRLALPAGTRLLVRLGGNATSVGAQRAALAAAGDVATVPDGTWTALRTAEPAGAATLRLSAAPSRLPAVWDEARRLLDGAGPSAFAHASAARGVARVVLSQAVDEEALAALLGARPPAGVTRIFERLPAPLWPRLAPTAADDRLSRGVRTAFDPERLLNPGILGEPPPDAPVLPMRAELL